MSSNILVQRICQNCNIEFTAKTTVTKYYSNNCGKNAWRKRKQILLSPKTDLKD